MKNKFGILGLLLIAFVVGGIAINWYLERSNFPEEVNVFIFTALVFGFVFAAMGLLGRRNS